MGSRWRERRGRTKGRVRRGLKVVPCPDASRGPPYDHASPADETIRGYGQGMLHTYATTLRWSGSTAGGYRGYSRTHTVVPHGAAPLELTADPSFLGTPTLANPEQLLLAAASSCQFLSFVALAARQGIDIVDYTDEASAVMPSDDLPVRITAITLRPVIRVRGADDATVRALVGQAHELCFIANSLTAAMTIEPTIEAVDG